MSKTYEITFITKEPFDSAQGKELKDSLVKKDIESFGGKILSENKLGQKTFTYPIQKEKGGFYTAYIFEIEADKVQELNRKLTMKEEILRHLIIVFSPSQKGLVTKPTKAIEIKPAETLAVIEEKPTEIMAEPFDKAQDKPVKEIVVEKPEVIEEKVEETKKEIEKPAKKEKIQKEVKAEEKEKKVEEVKEEKPKKEAKPTKPDVEPVDEEERLEALDKKLEELLKE